MSAAIPPSPEAVARRNEIATGAVAIVVLAGLLAWALGTGEGGSAGTELRASFNRIDGLALGSDVKIAGVAVGRVTAETIDPSSYLATVRFSIRPDLHLPVDSSASILSEGLLGGKYLSIAPGGDTRVLAAGGLITATQGSIGLETLLGNFIGSVTGLMDAVKASNRAAGHPPPGQGGPSALDSLGP